MSRRKERPWPHETRRLFALNLFERLMRQAHLLNGAFEYYRDYSGLEGKADALEQLTGILRTFTDEVSDVHDEGVRSHVFDDTLFPTVSQEMYDREEKPRPGVWADALPWSEKMVRGMATGLRSSGPWEEKERELLIGRATDMANAAERQGVNASELRSLIAHVGYGEIP